MKFIQFVIVLLSFSNLVRGEESIDCGAIGDFTYFHAEDASENSLYFYELYMDNLLKSDPLNLYGVYGQNIKVPFFPAPSSEVMRRYFAMVEELETKGLSNEDLATAKLKLHPYLLLTSLSRFGFDSINGYAQERLGGVVGHKSISKISVNAGILHEIFTGENELFNFLGKDIPYSRFLSGALNNSIERFVSSKESSGTNRFIFLSHNYGSFIANQAIEKLNRSRSLSECTAHVSLNGYISPGNNFFSDFELSKGGFSFLNHELDLTFGYMSNAFFKMTGESFYPVNYSPKAADWGAGYLQSGTLESLFLYSEPFENKLTGKQVSMVDELLTELNEANNYLDRSRFPISIKNLKGANFDNLVGDVYFQAFSLNGSNILTINWDTNGDGSIDCNEIECTGVQLPSIYSNKKISVEVQLDDGRIISEEMSWEAEERSSMLFDRVYADSYSTYRFSQLETGLIDFEGDGIIDASGTEFQVNNDVIEKRNLYRVAYIKDGRMFAGVGDWSQRLKTYAYSKNKDCDEEGFYIAPRFLELGENPSQFLFISKDTGVVHDSLGLQKNVRVCSGSTIVSEHWSTSGAFQFENVTLKDVNIYKPKNSSPWLSISDSNLDRVEITEGGASFGLTVKECDIVDSRLVVSSDFSDMGIGLSQCDMDSSEILGDIQFQAHPVSTEFQKGGPKRKIHNTVVGTNNHLLHPPYFYNTDLVNVVVDFMNFDEMESLYIHNSEFINTRLSFSQPNSDDTFSRNIMVSDCRFKNINVTGEVNINAGINDVFDFCHFENLKMEEVRSQGGKGVRAIGTIVEPGEEYASKIEKSTIQDVDIYRSSITNGLISGSELGRIEISDSSIIDSRIFNSSTSVSKISNNTIIRDESSVSGSVVKNNSSLSGSTATDSVVDTTVLIRSSVYSSNVLELGTLIEVQINNNIIRDK